MWVEARRTGIVLGGFAPGSFNGRDSDIAGTHAQVCPHMARCLLAICYSENFAVQITHEYERDMGCSYPEASGGNAASPSIAVSPFGQIAWTPSQSNQCSVLIVIMLG